MHHNPLVHFKRLRRMLGGVILLVTFAQLADSSPWFVLPALVGLVLMLSVVVPISRETRRMIDAAGKDSDVSDPKLTRTWRRE